MTPDEIDANHELTVVELAHKMRELSIQLDEANRVKKDLQSDYDMLRKSLIPQAMENEGISNVAVTGVGSLQLRSDLYVSIPSERKTEAFDWLIGTGHGGVIKAAVHPGTLKALLKDLLKEGADQPPEDVIKVTPYTMAVLVRKKKD